MSEPRPKGACVDCWVGRAESDAWKRRHAPHPGPRCATHHRVVKRARSERRHRAQVARTYVGIGQDGYDRLLTAQGGTCAGCGPITGRNGSTKRLAVDHDHKTGEVRGLLCGGGSPLGGGSGCNRILGLVHDNPEILERLAAYLRNPPARAVLGVDCERCLGKGGDLSGPCSDCLGSGKMPAWSGTCPSACAAQHPGREHGQS